MCKEGRERVQLTIVFGSGKKEEGKTWGEL
jgi:hypothetical protein